MIDSDKLISTATALGSGDYQKGLELMSWQNYRAAEKLYHVTPAKNTTKILFAGLVGKATNKVERGKAPIIWFFVGDTNGYIQNMADEMANVLLMSWINEGCADDKGAKYSLFEIDKASIQDDGVIWEGIGEFCALGSFGYRSSKLAARHIQLVGTYWLPFDIERQTITIGGRKYRPSMGGIRKIVRQAGLAKRNT